MAGNLDDLDLQHSDDDGQLPADHNKLLGAVSQLYEKKRVKAPTRKEPSLEVSEFHLSQPDKKQGRVKVTELAKVLNKRAVHAEIGHKLKVARKRARTLPRPLEKYHADQITRAAGYEHAKRQLNRWDAVVYQHKVAEQLRFPLKNETVRVHQETTDVSKLFRKPTELELKLAELLKEPDPTKPLKEDESKTEEKEEEYPLTLAEVREKRKLMAKLRAQQSYKQSKAARHSKIKSKKFHQIQRRARVKEQLKEFEELQKKDPEAALRKLEELERTRAEERVTLRHRSTGQWAKNLSVRAKYDKEARIALSEQLAKSRELTVKLAQDKNSESEEDEEVPEKDLNSAEREEDPNNPWVVKPSKEIEDFLSGYRKFWEKREKNKEGIDNGNTDDSTVKTLSTTEETTNKGIPDDENSDEAPELIMVEDTELDMDEKEEKSAEVTSGPRKVKTSSENRKKCEKIHTKDDSMDLNGKDSIDFDDHEISFGRKSITKNVFNVSSSNLNVKNINTIESKSIFSDVNKSIDHDVGVFEVSDSCKKKLKQIKFGNMHTSFTISKTPVKTSLKNKESVLSSTPVKNSDVNDKTGSWSVSKTSKTKNSTTLESRVGKENVAQTPTGKFLVSECSSKHEINHKGTNSKTAKSIDDLFEEVEDKLQDKISEKYAKLKETLTKRKSEVDSGVESDNEEMPSLELKKQKVTADVDDELLEQTGSGTKANEDAVTTLAKASSKEVRTADDIDPNKFLKVTPRQVLTKLPDMATEGDEAMDDEESAEARHLTISEAFAEDDVVSQFQKDKEEEAKKNVVGDVDLTLPGWGSWGGHDIKPTNRRKRKKFVIKFPKVLPRRDSNRGNVIINEDADQPIKDHQISDVPYPFTSVKEYEASIRAPLGATWVPQTAHTKLTAPTLITRMGTVITPMDDSQLVKKDKNNALPNNKIKKKYKVMNKT